jgi:serine/threonine-protein kinase
MAITCTNCQTANVDTSRYCRQCGASLPQPTLIEEARTGMLPPNATLQSRYIITNRLGQGGMGAVYAAIDARITGKRWAVKEMSDAAITSPLEKERAITGFRREAEMLARLSHPNLPAVTDFFSEGGKQYLVMELVQGQTLAEMMAGRDTPFSEDQVLTWVEQLCAVLDFLHHQQPPIVFRDLKPANIMREDTGLIKLIDFGIARFFKPGRVQDTQLMGTPGYAAPEQYGHGQTDARSDIYSLGMTMHHLLTRHDPGLTPFNPPPARQLNPAVSANTERVIQQAVRQLPEERFRSIAAMRQALFHPPVVDAAPTVLEPALPEAAPVPPVQPAPTQPARSGLPAWIWAAGGLLLIGICLVLVVGIAGMLAANNGGLAGLLPGLVADRTPTATTPAVAGITEIATRPATETPAGDEPTSPEPAADTPTPEPGTDTPGPAVTDTAPAPTRTPAPAPPPQELPETELVIGASAGGEELLAYQIGNGRRDFVVVGGLHAGFAPSSVTFVERFREYVQDNPDRLPASVTLYLLPNVNPDSPYDPGEKPGRLNANGVDLNRNWGCNWSETGTWRSEPIDGGPAPFSEPETQALRDFLTALRPEVVLFYEAFARDGIVAAGNCNGNSSGSGPLAEIYAENSGYLVDTFTLTGDSSDWLVSQDIPSISILLKDYVTVSNSDWQDNLAGLLAVLAEIQ